MTSWKEILSLGEENETRFKDELSSISNLHYASAWASTGGGFSGAIFSGYMCAINILRKKK